MTLTNPLPGWWPNFTMQYDAANKKFIPTYEYNRQRAAEFAITLSRGNFPNFPQDSAASIVGYIDSDVSRVRRNYSAVLTHVTGQGTGSSIFISEVIHFGGLPMTIDQGDNPDAPDCTEADQGNYGHYRTYGWRYCPPETSATGNWKNHIGIAQYFDSLPFGNLIGTVTLAQIETVIWTGPTPGFSLSGTLKGDPDNPTDPNEENFTNMRNRFAPGGDLASVTIGDYLYIESHGFIVVGWGPFDATIEGITYALNNPLATVRSSANPIPYIADFCYGTDGTTDGTGWLQDPRPRPFYAAATRVFQESLRPDQIPYVKRRHVHRPPQDPPGNIEPVYDNFLAENDNWQFYKIPNSIALSSLPLDRMYFCG